MWPSFGTWNCIKLGLILWMGGWACRSAPPPEPPPPNPDQRLVRLVEAYPEILIGIRNDSLLWCDGSLLPFDEPRPFGSFQDMLNEADLRAQMTQRYPVGKEYALPRINQDPGRVRNSAFFKKMYGATKEEVEASLVEVRWLPSRGNQSLRVTSVNGVADKLHAISLALDSLPDSLLRFVQPPVGGTYAWRPIAGTDRLSMHSFGMAIDIVVANSHYWRWDHPAEDLPIPYQNRIPWAIVEIFERYGFIWGGKWYHYDTMHFEYRPELFPRGTNFHP